MDKDKIGEALSRRNMLGTLGAAAGSMAFANAAFAQGGCRDGYNQAANSRCPLSMEQATAPIKEVFDSTGWSTTAMESFTIDVVDYKKEAAFYAALMGWKLREDDGKQAIMDVGNWGNAILRAAPAGSMGAARGPNGAAPRAQVKALPG